MAAALRRGGPSRRVPDLPGPGQQHLHVLPMGRQQTVLLVASSAGFQESRVRPGRCRPISSHLTPSSGCVLMRDHAAAVFSRLFEVTSISLTAPSPCRRAPSNRRRWFPEAPLGFIRRAGSGQIHAFPEENRVLPCPIQIWVSSSSTAGAGPGPAPQIHFT